MNEKENAGTLKPIGEAIKELLVKNKYSYQELADKTGISKPYIAEIISKNKTPRIDKLKKIAQAFNLDPYYFREYRLMRLITHIENNPEKLKYDNEEDIISVIDINNIINEQKKFKEAKKELTKEEEEKLAIRLAELYQNETERENFYKFVKFGVLIKTLQELTDEVFDFSLDDLKNINDKDLGLMIYVIKKSLKIL